MTGIAATQEAALPGLVWAFRFHADGRAESLDVAQPIDDRHDGWLWLHFDLADRRACRTIDGLAKLPAAAVGVLSAIEAPQQVHAAEGCIYGVVTDLGQGLGGPQGEFGELHFAMTERLLISGRHKALSAVEQARRALLDGRRLTSVASLLELVVEHVAEAIDGYADTLGEQLDDIEETIVGRPLSDERQRLGGIRKTSVRIHRRLTGLRTSFRRIEVEADPEANPALRLATGRLLQRLDGLDHDIMALRERAHLLQEEVTLKMAEETNRHLSLLAVVTTLFLPASLITGFFGMNVKGLPLTDDESGFLWAVGILVLASVLAVLMLRRLGVLRG